MTRYIALLRGINISGKNKIAMGQLKQEFEHLGFEDVKTWLNSGNVVFSCPERDNVSIAEDIKRMIAGSFGFNIPIYVISADRLKDILSHSPAWWDSGDKEIYDNLIFIIPPAEFSDVYQAIGEPKEGLEQIMNYEDAIFWSFSLKSYQKTNWWPKTAREDIGSSLTIRTAGTVRKLVEM